MESCWSVFFWSWTSRKKSRSDPQGRSRSSSRMRTLTPELIITSAAADSHPRAESRDSESGWHSTRILPVHLRFAAHASTVDVQERLRIASAAHPPLLSRARHRRRGRNASAAQTGQRDACERNFPESALSRLTREGTCRISHKEGADASLIVTEATSV